MPMEFRVRSIGLWLMAILASRLCAVSGISVCTKDGTGTLTYYGIQKGQLWRNTIIDNDVTSEKIFDGPCTRPALNPSGTKVAFLKGSRISVIGISGGDVTELADGSENGYLDFPSDEWVYFTMGSYHDAGSKQLKRVRADGSGSREDVVTYTWRVSQIGICNDLSKAAMRTGDVDGDVRNKIIVADVPGDGSSYLDRSGGSTWSCATGMFADGEHVMDGWQDGVGGGTHAGMDIRNVSDGGLAAAYANADALGWPPNSGSWRPSGNGNTHGIFHSCAATNSDRWACMVMGNASNRNYISEGQVLFNWKDQECIVPTKDLIGTFDHGDFWAGNPCADGGPLADADVCASAVRMRSPAKMLLDGLTVSGLTNGFTIQLSSVGNHTVEVVTLSGSVARSYSGTGDAHYTASLAPGTYLIKAQAASGRHLERIVIR